MPTVTNSTDGRYLSADATQQLGNPRGADPLASVARVTLGTGKDFFWLMVVALIALMVPSPCAVVVEDSFFKESIVENRDHFTVAAMSGDC